MPLFKKIFLYLPILLGVSMIFSIPVGFIFTKAHYGFGALEMMGNTIDYFFNGTKLSYMFFMWPIGVLLELPIFLIVLLPLSIIILKLKFGTFGYDQIIAGILGIIFALVVLFMKKRGYFNWFPKIGASTAITKRDIFIQNFFANFFILACIVFLTFFLSYFTGEYILVHLSREFRETGGSWIGPPEEIMRFLLGVPVTYVFFVGFLFSLFGQGRKEYWYLSVLLALPLPYIGGPIWLLWTLVFFVIGIFIAKSINKISISYSRYCGRKKLVE